MAKYESLITEKFMEEYYKNNDEYTSIIEQIINDNEFKQLTVKLHTSKNDQPIVLKLKNLVDLDLIKPDNDKNMYIPYSNLSLFKIFNSNNREEINLYKTYLGFLKRVKRLNTSNGSNGSNYLNNLSDDDIKKFGKHIFKDSMISDAISEKYKNKLNKISDLYYFNKIFISNNNFNNSPLPDEKDNRNYYQFIYNYNYNYNKTERYSKPLPTDLINPTQNYLFNKYKNFVLDNVDKYEDDDISDDDYKKTVTFYNILNILKQVIPINAIIKNDAGEQFKIIKEITENQEYNKSFNVTVDEIKVDFDITLEKIENITNVIFYLNLNGDIKANNLKFTPSMLDPNNSNYSGNNIYFSTEYRITTPLLNRESFTKNYGEKFDKRLFFLNKEFQIFVINYLKEFMSYKQNKSDSKDVIKNNINLIIEYFFKKSNNPKHKNNGIIFYKDKEYYINNVSNIDYTFGQRQNFETVSIDLNLLDKSTGPITYARKILSSSCNKRCVEIDKTITNTFKPLLMNREINFFQKLLNKSKITDKYDFNKLLDKYYPKKLNPSKKLQPKENKTTKIGGGKRNIYKNITKKLTNKKNKSIKKKRFFKKNKSKKNKKK